MAYTYSSAFVRASRDSVEWVHTDLSQVKLNDILNNYKDIYIVLTNPVVSGPLYLTRTGLESVMPPAIPEPTLTAWLVSIGNMTLPTQALPPASVVTPVGYADAWQAGYKAVLSDHTRAPDTQLPNAAKPDLLLTKAGVDLYAMAKYLLVTVNGFLHPTSGSVNGLYVLGGGTSGKKANDNHVGVLSFLNVGAIQQIPLTADMFFKPNPALKYSQNVYVKLPVSLTGKTLLLSIGGYLHVLDDAYTVVGDNTVKIAVRKLPLLQRLFQSNGSIDLSSLPIEKGPRNAEQFALETVYTDATISAYLTLPQSFAIVVDTAQFYRRVKQLETPKLSGRFFSPSPDRFPLIGAHGRLYDYRLSKEDDTYVYGTDPALSPQFLFETTDANNLLSASSAKQGYRRVIPTQGQLLEFGTYT